MKRLRYQRGVSLSGLLAFSALIGTIAVVGMRLFPLYNEKFKVDSALQHAAAQPDAAVTSTQEIMKVIVRDFEVSDVDRFESTQALAKVFDVETITNSRDKRMHMAYEIRGPFFGPLDIVLKYDNTIVLTARPE
jgi:hypothetical protein